jgi:hypothetical protein
MSATDFDFLIGSWTVSNRRLIARAVGCSEWDQFSATSTFWKLLDGVANVDEFDCPERGFKGMSVRTFDLMEQRWSIYWVNSSDGLLQPPVVGRFADRCGEFIGHDKDGSIPILARFIWTVDPSTPRWEQAFSIDDGATWETNWIMDFAR